jgi:glucose-1-phosphate cytidylyltransferase
VEEVVPHGRVGIPVVIDSSAWNSHFGIKSATSEYEIINTRSEDWTIDFFETGIDTQTEGGLKRVAKYLQDEAFCMTYEDGISKIAITKEIEFHKSHGRLATVAAVRPPGRFARLVVNPPGRWLILARSPMTRWD